MEENHYESKQIPRWNVVGAVKGRINELERTLNRQDRPAGDKQSINRMRNELLQGKAWLDTYGEIVKQDLHSWS